MFKNYLKGIEGIASYPVFSLVVFFVFFLAMSIWVIRARKEQLDELARLPFHDTKDSNKINE